MNIMNIKFIWISLITLVLLHNVDGKRTKKKRISLDNTETTPQPNVVTYSTFGFKDVGGYNGFIPSSPDYNSFLTTNNRDSSTRLYAPAFPSSIDSTGLGNYYDPQPDAAAHTITSDGLVTHVKSYQPASINFFTSPSFDGNSDLNKNTEIKDLYEINNFNNNSPIYGAKLSSKNKNKNFNNVNHTDYNIFSSVSSVMNGNTAITDNVSNNYPIVSHGQADDEKIIKIPPPLDSTQLKFPKVVDFTNVKNYYPTSVESKFTESMNRPYNLDIFNNGGSDSISKPLDKNKYKTKEKDEQSFNNKWQLKDEKTNTFIKSDEKNILDVNTFQNEDNTENYPIAYNNYKKNKLRNEYKDKVKIKPYNFGLENNANNHGNAFKGYEYSTNYSNTNFKFDSGVPKMPFNSSIDEIVPAGSNLDFVDYQFPDKDFSNFKTSYIKPTTYNFDTDNVFSIPKNKYKLSEEYVNSFKNSFTTPKTTSHWGSIFKDSEFSSYKSHPKKPFLNDDSSDDIVNIPKRPPSLDFEKYFDSKPTDWGFTDNYKPHKPVKSRDQYDWMTKDSSNRYKSEEDLLDLRNHEASHPSHVPFKPNYNNFDEVIDYKKLAAKWKQNFLKAKYRDSVREYESFASEPKPIHVPFPKPYPIEVPHPVVVPVPQPYPVKVPIPKPVAVPVIRELTVPVEKPVPYPVFKKVPYPIVKFVPVPVVKQVPVPVVKPYPVHIPSIRPVFHHTKPYDDEREMDPYEEEYIPRPDSKRPSVKRPKTSRNRHRPSTSKRPSRTPYQDRDRRRIPNRRPTSYHDHRERQRRPYSSESYTPHRYRNEFDEDDSDSDFERYCKRTGKC